MEPKTFIPPNNSRKGVAFKLVPFPYGANSLTDPNGNRTAVEAHADPATRWLQTVEYSNGTGEVALTKVQAEPDANGAQRWIGTGRTVLNNKGNPVKQYEPYFSDNDGWESEPEIVEKGVTPIMYYDPLSRLIKTDFPDGTHSKVEFTAWRQDDYDQNDTAEGNPHYDTPTITHLDSLGRPFYVVTNDGENNNIVTRTVLDIEGNEKEIIDARNNTVMKYKYGIHGEKAYTKSMDAGERWMLLAADEQPVYTWDSRGHKLHVEYDELRRPTKQWLNDETLVGETVYGESNNNPTVNNLRGQMWKIYDQSGVVENISYDFKGNLLESKRQLTQEYKQLINWSASPVLEDETFTTITAYDALNRAIDILTPHNDNIPASKIIPGYDVGGLLKTVNVNLRGATESTSFVEDINYNSKGQRERIKYGNGATTKYTYDEKTFRLTRLWTFRNGGTENLQDLNYTYDPVGNITEIIDNAQQTIFFNGQVVNPSQKFEYDALYRLVKATGREHVDNGADTEPEDSGYSNIHAPMPGDATALRNYTRQWKYDEVGNILKLIHNANSGNWNRTYNYDDNNNRLISTVVGETKVDYNYNEHGSMTEMPHLQDMKWDFAERLSRITRGTTEAYYNYDGSGERVRKVVEKSEITETRLYLGGFEIFRKKVGDNLELERETLHVMDDTRRIALVETLTYENGNLIANSIPVQRYQLSNNIESATLELDETANIISYEEYYPYGDTSYQAGRSASEVSQKRYRYTGKEKDEESGLYYHGARYYAAWLGRWTTVDPAGLVDGVNLYMYCRGDPVKLMDPSGMTSSTDPDNASNYHEFEPLEVKGDPPTRAPNPFRRILSGIVSLFSSSEKRENARLVDAEAYNRLMNIEYNIDNYELYLHFYLEAFTGVFTDTINYESIKQELSNIQRDCPDEAAKAGLELLTRISKKTGLEHSATIVKMGDNSYHLRNFRVGTQTNVIIPGINTPEVVNEFGQLTPDNVAGYIHTHVPVRGGKRTSFSLQDFETSYGKRRPIYLRYTGDTRGRVFRLTPPNSNAHRVQMRVAIIRNNEHKLPSFLRSERLVSEIK